MHQLYKTPTSIPLASSFTLPNNARETAKQQHRLAGKRAEPPLPGKQHEGMASAKDVLKSIHQEQGKDEGRDEAQARGTGAEGWACWHHVFSSGGTWILRNVCTKMYIKWLGSMYLTKDTSSRH